MRVLGVLLFVDKKRILPAHSKDAVQLPPAARRCDPVVCRDVREERPLRLQRFQRSVHIGGEMCIRDSNGPGCFSGSATEMDDGKQLLMYTSVVAEKQPNGEMRDIQTQSIAIGDGLNYEKPACNPVLTQKDLPEGFSKFDFRDPKIWREADGTYSAVTVCLAEMCIRDRP